MSDTQIVLVKPGAGWYDQGGVLPSGRETVRNDTDHPIPVSTEDHIRHGRHYIRDRYDPAPTTRRY